MLRLRLCLLNALLLCLHVANAQFDANFCPSGLTPPIPDPRWRAIPSRFELVTELVANDGVAELSQAFSVQRDAVLFTTSDSRHSLLCSTSPKLFFSFQRN